MRRLDLAKDDPLASATFRSRRPPLHYSDVDRPVVITHYDADFDHLASVEPALQIRWIVPRGTVS
jgi:hypothetical protein